MLILGIESSCDETAASVAEDCRTIRSSVISTQIEEHKKYGGVVPEIASRRHCENILGVTRKALDDAGVTLSDLDGIAVTYAPGLIGALLVGVNFAKGLAMASGKPLIPVHHIAGHIATNYLSHPQLEPPYLCLVASGGHSHIIEVLSYTKFRVVGRTHDDAAGECFDKCARAMGFPYPGGVHVDAAAQKGDPAAFKLPHPTVAGSEFDFSFSGLKTAVINMLHHAEQKGETIDRNDLSASLQATISQILTDKTMLAAQALGYKKIALAGGVSANSGVRAALSQACERRGYEFFMPEKSLCGDNGAMIACQGSYNFLAGITADESLNAVATLSMDKI
ncbi:MAG: tRNA (adenosine(37)-N6)-threonylcarbamoyltransferase complex transferase subunit TsaD [Ruminococcus sp.]|nr:tRNA (adenosine(37)-N6)-threonylcarbamoyltransferase complex transferase subunit TsaD [Ruminococcus sp.]MBQ3856776.1 tRNA (adenosine(37)-N6)-threonylcarbamoyltransferase complex transferase subunit TsaD [Ruminococcus sp.]MBQ8122187.1 tRNA (adenosine(37)-N6)-threonylcarbamoyltransferase complex transferase subunit TsaD [Ruminococcus sp.]